jgi:FMN phosphatase YigB (HAD superfamily)
MKKEIAITIIIIITIIVADYITQKYTAKCMDEISEKLEFIKQEANSKNTSSEELTNQAKEVYSDWKSKDEMLSYYLEHTELEKINTQLRKTIAYFEADVQDQCVPEIENGIYLLEHLKAKQAFSLRNIF